jgi:3-hydroxybutyryl-CoA dehydrogenase
MLSDIGLLGQAQHGVVLSHIHASTVFADVVGAADVVIEAVFENLELKQEIFQRLDQQCPEHTILASNTSTLLPSKLAAVTRRPDKVLVAHYFNPPFLLPLVELVRHPGTSDETVTTMHALLSKIGKKPAIVQKEVPGFIGNRLQAALLREAFSLVEQGIATPQDVDVVVKNGFGRRYAAAGTFEIFELAGWDLILAAWPYLVPDLESSTEIPALLREKVELGELGVKTGMGFYEWTPESVEALKKRIAQAVTMIARLS